MGQWRQRCLQPRLASVEPTMRKPFPGMMRCAYFSIAGIPDRSGTSNCSRAMEIVDSERAQILNVHGSVQAVTTEMRTWIQLAKPGNELRCEPRGGVHGQIDGDEPGIGNQRVIQGPPGKVEH